MPIVVKRKAIYDQYGNKGLKNGVPSREGILPASLHLRSYSFCVDFDGFPGGYNFHQDGEQVFNQFFGTKNPFSGMIISIY
jgi:DnaJ-class molecular chaperone